MKEQSMKRIHLKLSLKKESLRRLTDKELKEAAGGLEPTQDCTIWTCLIGL